MTETEKTLRDSLKNNISVIVTLVLFAISNIAALSYGYAEIRSDLAAQRERGSDLRRNVDDLKQWQDDFPKAALDIRVANLETSVQSIVTEVKIGNAQAREADQQMRAIISDINTNLQLAIQRIDMTPMKKINDTSLHEFRVIPIRRTE